MSGPGAFLYSESLGNEVMKLRSLDIGFVAFGTLRGRFGSPESSSIQQSDSRVIDRISISEAP